MLRLNARLEKADIQDPSSGAEIIDILDDGIAHVAGDDSPPLTLFAYLVRKLIYPDPSYEDIPRLLELFVHIEAIRQRAVEQAQAALKLQQKFIESQEPGVTLLKKADERKLRGIIDEDLDKSLRLIFREDIMHNLCRLHIRHLWTSEESHTILRFMKRYFPSNYVREGDPFADQYWKDVVHFGLVLDERKRVHVVGEEMRAFLLAARAWDLEREKYFDSLGISDDIAFGENEFISYPRDFNAKFRAVADEKRMLESIKMYVKKVEDSVNTLERIFPNSRPKAKSAEAVFQGETEASGR